MPGKAVLKDEELAGLVQRVGFSSTRMHRGFREDVTAVAIILAESGGNANAHNTTPPDDSYGLFQINMYGRLRDERAKRYNLRSMSNLFEPVRNAEIAYDIFKQAGMRFTPWSTYTSGSYLRFIPRAEAAIKNPDDRLPTIGDSLGGALENVVPSPLQDFEKLLPRIGYFVGGVLVLLVALVLFGGQNAGKVVRAAPGIGKVAKTVRKVT